jgi:ABC-type sulfate transport system permease subunit
MSPLMLKLLFVLLSVTVPIVWGIAVNWLFRRLHPPGKPSAEDKDPTIEYYI